MRVLIRARDARDPRRRELARHEHRRDADAGRRPAAGEDDVARRRARGCAAGTGRSARTCAPRRTGCPPRGPSRPQSAGVTRCSGRPASPKPSMPAARQHAAAARRGSAGPMRSQSSGAVVGVRGGREHGHAARCPSGASDGSVAVGRVTSSDGSVISRPSVMISSNVPAQASPKEIVWCAESSAPGAGRQPGVQHERPRATSAAAPARRGVRPEQAVGRRADPG